MKGPNVANLILTGVGRWNGEATPRQDHRTLSETLILLLLKSSAAPLTFEEIIGKLPELSWNQVFLGVDELSRRGAIILKRRGYSYEVSAESGAFGQVGY